MSSIAHKYSFKPRENKGIKKKRDLKPENNSTKIDCFYFIFFTFTSFIFTINKSKEGFIYYRIEIKNARFNYFFLILFGFDFSTTDQLRDV